MLRCFKRKDRGPSAKPVESKPPSKVKTVAIFAGHQKNGGARTYNNREENEVNTRLVNRIIKLLPNHNIVTRERLTSSYGSEMSKHASFAKKEGAELAIELHFNAAGIPEARGAEALIAYGKEKTAHTAKMIVDKWCQKFKIAHRGNHLGLKGVKGLKSKNRGSGFVSKMESKGIQAIVWEPFFCDYQTSESQQFLNQRDQGVEIMAQFWAQVIRELT
jgi:N-acetylmuramoyl-L-alanine amidase